MSDATHTPGPWEARHVPGWGSDAQVIAESWPRPIAVIQHHPDRYYRHVTVKRDGGEVTTFADPTPEGEARVAEVEAIRTANAHLIAAAPELLDALERTLANFVRLLEQKPVRDAAETIAEAERALSKARAKGGSHG